MHQDDRKASRTNRMSRITLDLGVGRWSDGQCVGELVGKSVS